MSTAKKVPSVTSSDDLTPGLHGNVKYPFHTLDKVGSYFIEPDAKKRYNIHSAVKHYNKAHDLHIKVSTKKVAAGLLVKRTK